MKTAFSALALMIGFFSTQPAFATSMVARRPVAQYTFAVGMLAQNIVARDVVLDNYGDVEVTEYHLKPQTGETWKTVKKSDWTFDGQVMLKISSAIEQLKGSPLVDLDAQKPSCMDAPSVTVKVYKEDGQAIDVARKFGCHTSLPKASSEQRAARYLVATLQNLYQAITQK